jgi:hypothetical protein
MRGLAAGMVAALAIACFGISAARAAGPVSQRDYDLGLDAFSLFGGTPICQPGGYTACTNRCEFRVSSCIKGKPSADIYRVCDPDYNACAQRCRARVAACAKH